MSAKLVMICRHPLKGHGREELAAVGLSAGQAMPWDRVWAVAHEKARLDPAGGWSRCVNFARAAWSPRLMALECRFDAEARHLVLRDPVLGEFAFHPDDADECAAAVAWLAPLNADGFKPARIVSADQPLTDSAWPSISLLSMSSLRDLGARMGQELSPHRFRGNLWVDGWAPWAEFDMIGQEVAIGPVRLLIRERITRCKATQANPATGIVDADTLSTLRDGWQHQDFGVYAEVLAGGGICTGDEVTT